MLFVDTYELPHQLDQMRQLLIMETGCMYRGMGLQYGYVRRRGGGFQETVMLMQCRLLNENNLVIFRQPRQEMLWALVYKVPAKMGKNDNGRHWISFNDG